jgi:uncharacterized membrane protein YhaH (DUF805 family)
MSLLKKMNPRNRFWLITLTGLAMFLLGGILIKHFVLHKKWDSSLMSLVAAVAAFLSSMALLDRRNAQKRMNKV